MSKELTDLKLAKIKVGSKSEFLGHEVNNQERIFIHGGLFVQLGKKCHMFRYIYRDSSGKARQITIGRFAPDGNGHESFNINQAKAIYMGIMDKREKGIDPLQHKLAEEKAKEIENKRRSTLFGDYCIQWLNKKFENKEVTSPTHKKKLQSYFTNTLATLKDVPLISITTEAIKEIFDSTMALSTNQQDKIHRINQLLHHLFHDAHKEKLIDNNPMLGIYPEDYTAPKRGHYKHINDLAVLCRFLQILPKVKGDPSTIALCKISPHWFTRPVEIRLLKWKDVDFENRKCNLHRAKIRGNSINEENHDEQPTDYYMPLSEPVATILKQLHTITGTKEYVFAGSNGDEPISDNTAGKALRTAMMREGLGHVTTMHGFRYTARSFLPGILGISKRVVEQQMTHNPDKNGEEAAASDDKYGYDQYLYLAERRAMMDIWSEFLEGLANGKYQELTPEEVSHLCESGDKPEWQVFIEELKNKYNRLCAIYQQVKK